MLVTSSRDPRWLSNSWLFADREGGHAVLVDTGGPVEPIRAAIEAWRVELAYVLCTHHHPDHVAHNADYRDAHGCPVCGHAAEASLFGDLDRTLADGEQIEAGALRVRAVHIPGHTLGQLGFVLNDGAAVCTGDTLFRGSVGGTRGVGHTTFEDLQHSILSVLMDLPQEALVYPGHMEPSTIGRERDENPFVLAWRQGLGGRRGPRCAAYGRPAELLFEAQDYDGGTKCQVRFLDDDSLDVVPGSRITGRA